MNYIKKYNSKTINRRTVKSKNSLLKVQCDKLWIECVKLRAGFKSEISERGRREGIILGAHHCRGKASNAQRYDLRNGICLDNTLEHICGIHSHNPATAEFYNELIKQRIIEREGKGIIEKLDQLKWVTNADLQLIEIVLQEEKKRLLIITSTTDFTTAKV
jgi:hypothetical protein